MEFYNHRTGAVDSWFEAVSPTSALGVDFGICRGHVGGAGGWWWCITQAAGLAAGSDLAALTALCEVRTSDLALLKQRLEGPIPKPDAAAPQGGCTTS